MSKYKELKRIKKTINLYHISNDNHDGEVFKPRIPDSICDHEQEDTTMNRVCFSSTISGACRAINFDHICGVEYYIHVPENIETIVKKGALYKPSKQLVFDTYFTNEYWIRRPVKMKCIGKAKFYYKEKTSNFRIWRPPVHFKWIEKY